MNEEDSELERLKAKRLAEMQKNISSRQEIQTPKSPEKIIHPNPRDSLIKILGFRGLEVLENAESQFPNESKIIVEKLSNGPELREKVKEDFETNGVIKSQKTPKFKTNSKYEIASSDRFKINKLLPSQ